MNDMMNPRRRWDRDDDSRRSKDEELGNLFFEGDCSSSNEWGDYGVAEESMLVYNTDIEDAIEEEEFVRKEGFNGEEDNIEDVIVVANDLLTMIKLPKCTTLKERVGGWEWTDIMIMMDFIQELEVVPDVDVSVKTAEFLNETLWKDDRRLRKLRNLEMATNERGGREVNSVVIVKDQFLEELDSLGMRHMPSKMAEFLREIQMRDKETVVKLQILGREMELNARKKICSFRNLRVSYRIEDALSDSISNVCYIFNDILYDIEFNEFACLCFVYAYGAIVMNNFYKAISEDQRLARHNYALCDTLTDIIDERENFVQELDVLANMFVPGKMGEFMKESLGEDIPNIMKLKILGREFELRAREKEVFIEKLK
nr:hypothetical protein [Tanacetum cinerariifolium]